VKNAFATLLRHGSLAAPARTLGAPTAWRLAGCYAVGAILVAIVQAVVPLAESGDGRVLSASAETWAFGTASGVRVVPAWLDAGLAMIGAFVMTVPVVIVYGRTRTRAAFDDSLANTVLVLPPVITAILIVVQSSLALAFSLTGIVAAVRFRTNLKDSRDALYIFAGVGIGFASGVYALDVALVASLIFVLLEVLTWRTDLGARLPPVVSDSGAIPTTASGASGPDATSRRNGKPAHPKHAEPDTQPPGREMRLRAQVTDADEGWRAVERVLEGRAKAWRRLGITGSGGRLVVLEYEVRLRKRHPAAELQDRIYRDGQPFVVAVELTPAETEPRPEQSAP
jgi:hypothetical protein